MAKLSTTNIFGDLLVDGMIHGNITGNLTGNASTATSATTATSAEKWTTARTITIGSKGKSVDGSGNVSWTLAEIGAAASSHGTHLTIGTGASNAAAGNHTHSYTYPVSGDWWNGGFVNVTTGGVSEVGKFLDFHNTDATTNDYSTRLQSNGDTKNLVSLPTANGSIPLMSKGDTSYWGMLAPDGGTSWIRTTSSGIIPFDQGKTSALGTSSWPFGNIYGTTIYENGTALSSKYATTSTTGSLSSLQTSAKGSLVAAINEVFQSGSNAKQGLVDALTSKGISASTSDSWDTLIGKLNNISSAQGADNIYAATSLPATGNTNDICIVSSPLPNHIHIGRIKPTSVDANDIWLDTDGTNLSERQYRTITIGKLSTNLRISSAYRMNSSGGYAAQVVAYYWDGSKWVVCCPVITTLKSTNSNSTGSISLGSSSRYDIVSSGGISVTMQVKEGIQYTGKCTVRVYHYYNYGNSSNTFTYTLNSYNKDGSLKGTFTKRTTLGDEGYYYFHDVTVPDPGGYIQLLATTSGSNAANDEYNLYMSVGGNKA